MITPERAAQMYHALKACLCWCTDKVWYSKTPPVKCSRCVAIEAYEADLSKSAEGATL